tara:strand:- start:878 stop:1267 length:390 start_codon:yes stop_codon:yes gene_type:complete
MNYTSKITSVNKTDSFNTQDGKVMNKYVVTFANGHNPHIYKIGDFGHEVGDEVSYDLDQSKNKAKLEKPQFKAAPQPKNSYSNPKDDVQKYIIRQSSLNRATDLFAGKPINVDEIINLARTFENYVHNG